MAWETDGPCRHKRQRPHADSPAFWKTCEESDWVINGSAPSFISTANASRVATNGGRYNLRQRVGISATRFTQSEDCGYEENFQDQLQEGVDNDDDDETEYSPLEPGVSAEDVEGDIIVLPNEDDDDVVSSDESSYQDESEESSCNEYHPGEGDNDDDEDDDEDDEDAEVEEDDLDIDGVDNIDDLDDLDLEIIDALFSGDELELEGDLL
jgi:hypothetical protein